MSLPTFVARGTEPNWAKNRRRMDQWLESLPKPVAILCIYDIRGQEIAMACQRLGINVPNEVAIVGVDNNEMTCQMCTPPLSSVDIHIEKDRV